MNEKFFIELKEKIRPYYKSGDGHGFDHTERVLKNALAISEEEEVDIDIVKASVLLHDVARLKEDTENICHAEEGAKMAKMILEEMRFPDEKIPAVAHAIEVHRFSKGLPAKTKEAEILQDADRLDALGAMILVRMIEASVKWGVPIHDPKIPVKEKYDGSKSTVMNHIHEKILKIRPESFNTNKAKEIAKERYVLVEDFAESYLKEFAENIN